MEDWTREEVRLERIRNLIGVMWNSDFVIDAFLNGQMDNEDLENHVKLIKKSKPYLKSALKSNITKEELNQLYIQE